MSAFSTTIALFVNRARTKAGILALESVDASIFGHTKLTDSLVRDVYQLKGGIQAVADDSGLTPTDKLRIAQRLTKCYLLDKIAFIEGNTLSAGGQIITTAGADIIASQIDHNKLKNVNPLSAFPNPLHVTSEQIARWDAGAGPPPIVQNTGIIYGGSYYHDDTSSSPFDFILVPTQWQFLGVVFTLPNEHFSIVPAQDGFSRIDLPVLTNAGTLVILPGTEISLPGATFAPGFDQASQLAYPPEPINVTADSAGQNTQEVPTQYKDSRNGLIGNLYELPDEITVRTDLIGSTKDEFTEKLFARTEDFGPISREVVIDPISGEEKIIFILDPDIGGNTTYQGAQPTNITVGGIPAGTNLVGFTFDEFVEKLTITYLLPTFSSFAITGQSTQIEVGSIIAAGSKTFTWGTTNNGNITANTIIVRNVTQAIDYLTGEANDGTAVYALGSDIVFSSARTEVFRILGTNTNAGGFQRDFNVQSFFGIFYQSNLLSAIPTNSATVRAMTNETFGSTFSLLIPQGQTKIAFSYVATRGDIVDSSIKYVEGFNANVGATFTKTTFNVNTNAPGSVATSYKTWSVTLPGPYSADATYNVTIPV